MNKQHKNINFTCEIEKENCLSFLDVMVRRTDNGIKTSVYRKQTFTGLGLNWFSFCSNIYKMNSVKTLLNRAYNICSSYVDFHEEVEFLKDFFTHNNYKLDTFYSILKSFLFSKRVEVVNNYDVPKLIKYVKFPFYGKPSFDFRKKIQKVLRANFPAVDFRFVFINNFTIKSFFKLKDVIPDSVCSNVVYQFDCPSCNARYIGCSSKAFRCRILEHIGRSFRTGQYLNRMPFSSIRNHSHERDHNFSEKDFKIIGRFSSHQEALIAERILISKMKPELNILNAA